MKSLPKDELAGEITHARYITPDHATGVYTPYGMAEGYCFRFEQDNKNAVITLDPMGGLSDGIGEGPLVLVFECDGTRDEDFIKSVDSYVFDVKRNSSLDLTTSRFKDSFENIVGVILNKFFDEHRVRVEEDDF